MLNQKKFNPLIITLLSATTLVMGCKKEQSASQQIDALQAKTAETAHDLKDYSYAQKPEYVKAMRTELADLGHDLDKLSTKIEASSEATKAESKPKLQALRDQSAKMSHQLDDLSNSTESTWESVKAGTKKSYAALKDGFQQSRQWVSDKIAP
jgi:cytochrome c556